MSAALCPPMKWAQRAEYVFLTIDVQDARDVKIDIQHNGEELRFSCTAPETAGGGAAAASSPAGTAAPVHVTYACALDLFRPVSAEESQHVTRPRHIEVKLKKRESGSEDDDEEEDALHRQWPRLTKLKMTLPQLHVDWSKWKDQDDEDGGDQDDLANFGLGEGGESGINYEDMMRQFMVKEGKMDAEQYAGVEGSDTIPSFGSAAGQASVEGTRDEDDDDDDMPPLEEDV